MHIELEDLATELAGRHYDEAVNLAQAWLAESPPEALVRELDRLPERDRERVRWLLRDVLAQKRREMRAYPVLFHNPRKAPAALPMATDELDTTAPEYWLSSETKLPLRDPGYVVQVPGRALTVIIAVITLDIHERPGFELTPAWLTARLPGCRVRIAEPTAIENAVLQARSLFAGLGGDLLPPPGILSDSENRFAYALGQLFVEEQAQ